MEMKKYVAGQEQEEVPIEVPQQKSYGQMMREKKAEEERIKSILARAEASSKIVEEAKKNLDEATNAVIKTKEEAVKIQKDYADAESAITSVAK